MCDDDDDEASLRDELEEARALCRSAPKNLPQRLALGDLLLERYPREALEVYREAVRLKPSYAKATKKVQEAEARCAAVGEDTSLKESPEDSKTDVSTTTAARRKARGNELFNQCRYEEAYECYCEAIEALKREGQRDAKLHTNRAACLLTAERWVPAAFDGQKAIDADPDWWKGYWYKGQALLGQLKGKKPSPAMQEKAQSALRALERASQCSAFPEDKRERVELLQARARNIAFYLAQNQCPQQ